MQKPRAMRRLQILNARLSTCRTRLGRTTTRYAEQLCAIHPLEPHATSQVARSIAAALQEVNEPAILKSVQLIGGDLALQVLGEALAIQQAGGQMVPSGNRKRTAGGVYFNLLRQHLNPGQFKQVFLHNKELFREKILRKNRRRNARKREKQGPQRRGAMDSPPVAAAPATVLASALAAWMAAAAGGGSSGGGGAGSAAEGGQESGSGGAHGAAHITVAASTVDAELDAELAELDALLDGDE